MPLSLAVRASFIHSSASRSHSSLSRVLIALSACWRHSSARFRNLSASVWVMAPGIMRKVKLGDWADSRTGRAHALAPIDRPWGARGQTRTCGLSGLSKRLSRPVRRSAFSLPYLECKRCSICRQNRRGSARSRSRSTCQAGKGLVGVKDDGQLAGARHLACAGEASRFLEW
jgi:hypothetical protein